MKEIKTDDLNLSVEDGNQEIILRHGKAADPVPIARDFTAAFNLKAVATHVANRAAELNVLSVATSMEGYVDRAGDSEHYADLMNLFRRSFVRINREKGVITFFENWGHHPQRLYIGSLEPHHILKRFGINEDKSYTTFELADFIKMHRTYFQTKEVAMKLVSDLRSFKAKVDKQIELSDDNRGNRRMLTAQAVESNIPEEFKLTLPLFRGYDAKTISVEVVIDSGDFSCRLISPEAADIMEEERNRLIYEEIEKIVTVAPNLRIFEE